MTRRADDLGDEWIGKIEWKRCSFGHDKTAQVGVERRVVDDGEEIGEAIALGVDRHNQRPDEAVIDEKDQQAISR